MENRAGPGLQQLKTAEASGAIALCTSLNSVCSANSNGFQTGHRRAQAQLGAAKKKRHFASHGCIATTAPIPPRGQGCADAKKDQLPASGTLEPPQSPAGE